MATREIIVRTYSGGTSSTGCQQWDTEEGVQIVRFELPNGRWIEVEAFSRKGLSPNELRVRGSGAMETILDVSNTLRLRVVQ
jgi:hypothetical protein